MKYTTYNVQQLNRKGKPWQARAKYKDIYGKWKEVSKMLPEAKGKKKAQRMAKEWFEQLNAEADLCNHKALDSSGDLPEAAAPNCQSHSHTVHGIRSPELQENGLGYLS